MEEIKTAAPAAPAPSTGAKSDRFWKITTVVLVIILVIFAFKDSFSGTSNAATGGVVAGPSAGAAGPTVDASKLAETDYVLGKKDAPVTIVEFSDYQCPFCGRLHAQVFPSLKSKYIDTGKVKYVFRDFPLSFHPEAEPAAIAANCAGEQGKYYEYNQKLYDGQANLGSALYKQLATELKLNVATWETCLKDPKQKAEIAKDTQDGLAVGVQGTPATFVNGQLISGAQPLAVFEQAIERALAGS